MTLSEKELDFIFREVDSYMRNDKWDILSDIFAGFITHFNDISVDIKLTYLVASFPGANKIQHRQEFLELCRKYHENERLWKGLDRK